MPLSAGVPIGLVILALGAVLLFTTQQKRTAKIIVGIGAAITVITLILIVLAANSQM